MTYLKICPKCRLQEFAANYCTQCGERTVENPDVPRCPHCHSPIAPSDRFCGICGRKLEEAR